eukprot:14141-Heterococcus_DN1.PRE.1
MDYELLDDAAARHCTARTLTAFLKQSTDGRTHLLFISSCSTATASSSSCTLSPWPSDRYTPPSPPVVPGTATVGFVCPACSTGDTAGVLAVSHSTCLGSIFETAHMQEEAGELSRNVLRTLFPAAPGAALVQAKRLRLRTVALCGRCSKCLYAAASKRLQVSLVQERRAQCAIVPTVSRLTADIASIRSEVHAILLLLLLCANCARRYNAKMAEARAAALLLTVQPPRRPQTAASTTVKRPHRALVTLSAPPLRSSDAPIIPPELDIVDRQLDTTSSSSGGVVEAQQWAVRPATSP